MKRKNSNNTERGIKEARERGEEKRRKTKKNEKN